ncbi:MAG: hypothetical protein E6H91_10895 [Chloroflexi bacterium]|nr:MAG: hypothetical protein E6H91_10895 [Chloroflexota bacterium]
MRPYLTTAHRYRWLLGAVLAIIWGAGIVAAYTEYATTFESEATIWVLRASPELATTSPDDPNATVIQTAASQQADLLNQLLQTKEFLRDVVRQTSLRAALAAAPDETKFLAGVQKSFRVQTHGNNLLTVSFAAHDPPLGPEMVNAILAVRADRVAQASTTFTTITNTLYQKQLQVAQAQALDAQRALDEFDASHPGALSDIEQHLKDQLRLTLDYAQIRLGDLRGRINQAALAPAILSVSGMEFQVVDQPQVETSPRGGTRSAAMIGAVAIAAGCALAALLVVIGTLLPAHVSGPADVSRLAPARLFAAVPRVTRAGGGASPGDLRTSLAAIAFADGGARNGEVSG